MLRKHSVGFTGCLDAKGFLGVIAHLLACHMHVFQLHRLLSVCV